ncbi:MULTISPECIES: glutathione S-transferase family protein [unclassified Paracoccus (in: a-proteobacteria)]|uniref:glutathione S-transferase family protein n=1 Tax=unclassified Paracoccus (in: a-proteobacteria) TaxID=2688777 RepID=UPI0012B3745B|nr:MULTISPECIES: glutathione S-transferase family protein [unclassified Paracoccus (in: a-proteobacteria)]UXU74728.1 glutathione S-transferase family protein [Paracoccus sp. SMMA_5]UXU80624.1 glutathione S-transferase family protein [Paracoccus sp. SMMA_5_TC]
MDELTLWHVPQSRSMRALWLLEEIGCPFRVETMDFFDGSLRRPPYDAIHPVGRVPALRDGTHVLHESGAIVEWLCETRAPHLGCPPGAPGRAAWLDWMHFGETLGQHIANLTQHHIVLRHDWQRSPTVMRLETARLSRALGLVEQALERHDWLMGMFSGVDCQLGYSVWVAARFVDLRDRPLLAAYRDRCAARPAFQRALPPPGTPVIYERDFYEVPDVPAG